MKIALLHDSVLPPKQYGGIERIVMALAKEYTRLGHHVVIASRKGSPLQDYEHVPLPEDHEHRDPKAYLPSGLDFLHVHQPRPVKPTLPFLVTIHGNGHTGEKYWRNTNFLSQSHARNHNAKYFVYNGIDTEAYPFREKKEDYVVFLAKAAWRVKNLRTCIDFARDTGLRLEVMGGTGVSSSLVKFHGMVGEADGKLEILSRAKALLYPTNWDEPCAVAPLESLACGTPVIASSNGCMPELVKPGTGFVCSSYAEMLNVSASISSLAPRACRAGVEEHFSMKRMALDYLALFDRILRHGELDHEPRYNFDRSSVQLLYKPTLRNRLSVLLRGKV